MTDQPTKAPRAPRTTHTPAQKATEAVNVLQRRLNKLTKSKAAFELQALELDPQIEAMQKRLDYAMSNPDFPQPEKTMAEQIASTPGSTTAPTVAPLPPTIESLAAAVPETPTV